MNSFASAQARWDNLHPADDSAYEAAATRWIENTAENLMAECDLIIPHGAQGPIVVEHSEYLKKVQAYLLQRLADGVDDECFLARLVISGQRGAPCRTESSALLGEGDSPLGKLFDIAESLVEPHVDAGLEADAEDARS